MSNQYNKKDLESYSRDELVSILNDQQGKIDAKDMEIKLLEAQLREDQRQIKSLYQKTSPRPKTPIGSLILFWIMALALLIIAGIELVSLHQWLNGG